MATSKNTPWPSDGRSAVKEGQEALEYVQGLGRKWLVVLLHPRVPALPHDAEVAKSHSVAPCSSSLTL